MATTLKRLGASAPAASTNTTLYNPSGVSAVVSTLFVCNRSSTTTAKFRIAVDTDATPDTEDYLYYDLEISPNDTFKVTAGLSLASGERIIVYANTADISFSAFGQETS